MQKLYTVYYIQFKPTLYIYASSVSLNSGKQKYYP